MAESSVCTVMENKKINAAAFAVTVRAGEMAQSARAGQFIHIKCGGERLLRRPVSICTAGNNTLGFVFEVRGEGTRWLSERKPGDTLDILGPLGNGFTLPEGDIIVVGGGVGVPPMLFAAFQAAVSQAARVTAVLGFRDMSRVMLKEQFEDICDEVYITTDDGSFGIHGAVTKPLEELLRKKAEGFGQGSQPNGSARTENYGQVCQPNGSARTENYGQVCQPNGSTNTDLCGQACQPNGSIKAVLACGPRAMLSAVAALCKRYGVPCQVSLEERMGCGVGACLVCACKTVKDGNEYMSRVCKDGPVFSGNEVAW